MIITNEIIELGRTKNRGFTKAQMYIVSHLIGTTISSEYIFPKNWKERFIGLEVDDVWGVRFINAKQYTSKDLVSKGVETCTGIPDSMAHLICKDQKMRSEKAKRKAEKRKLKKKIKKQAMILEKYETRKTK